MTAPLFTVVIPWHGRMDDLARAVASLDAQTVRDFEILVVCNGPGVEMQTEAEQRFPQCRFTSSGKPDVCLARNHGADEARGTWIAYLDADDTFLPGKLEKMAAAIASGNADIYSSRGYRVRSETSRALYPPQLLQEGENPGEFFFSRGANFTGTATVVRTETARRVRYSEGLKNYDDADFVIRAVYAGARMHMLPEALYEWYDDRETGRISRFTGYSSLIEWAGNCPALTEKARTAFLSRRVAQHIFPKRFFWCLGRFYNGWRTGGIPAGETLAFMVRALLPASAVRWLVTQKTRRDARRAETV